MSHMNDMKYELLAELNSRLEAELLESYLEANGVDVELFQESVGQNAFPVTNDILGRVQVFVPKEKIKDAMKLLNSFQE
jgi:ATP phosphoribosyltransferase regulatory subunit HisZ